MSKFSFEIKKGYQRYTIDREGEVCKDCKTPMNIRYYLTSPTTNIRDLYKITSKCDCGMKIVLNKTGVVLFVKKKYLYSKKKFTEQKNEMGKVAVIKNLKNDKVTV